MKNQLVKPIVKVGNSAGVILPREWLNGKAKIELIRRPVNIKKDVFEILNKYLKEIIGIYLVGSYARNEETDKSDIDILTITSSIDKEIKNGKYHIIFISKQHVEEQLRNNALPILAMIKEAKGILNANLIDKYKSEKLTRQNIKWHIETTRSALDVIKTSLEMDMVGGAEVYSLVLRLRTIYIINCLDKDMEYSKKGLMRIIKELTGSLEVYKVYEAVKNSGKSKAIPIECVEKLYNYVDRKTREWEKWIKQEKRG